MKTLIKIIWIATLLVTFSCSNDDDTTQVEIQEEQEVLVATVSNMTPTSGPKTTVVTFTGTNFGTDSSTIQVFFDDIEATVQSVTNTQIQTTVPPRAFEGEVTLIINGIEITGFTFEYIIVDINVSTLAGSTQGYVDDNSLNAKFDNPFDIALDGQGNFYIADSFNNRIRKITPDGDVSTLAGNGQQGFEDGIGTDAQFFLPLGLATDNVGNIYVADTFNHRIRKITPEGVVSTLAGNGQQGFEDGIGTNAKFSQPNGLIIDSSGNVFVADRSNNRIRKITPEGIVSTIAGSTAGFADGIGTAAQFDTPTGITMDSEGVLYVADRGNHKIRKITQNGEVSTIAGSIQGFVDGVSNIAQFNAPRKITIDNQKNLYISDLANHRIRKITQEGIVSTLAGSTGGFVDGTATNAQFNAPSGIVIDTSRTIHVADINNHKIRKITQE